MKGFTTLLAGLLAMPLTGCAFWGGQKHGTEQKAAYHRLSPKEAKAQLDSEPEIVLLDVRTPEEYKEAHIDGSILIPDYELPTRYNTKLPDKDAKIFVYCRSGMRADGAARLLANVGYTNVYNIGGILNWPYETIRK